MKSFILILVLTGISFILIPGETIAQAALPDSLVFEGSQIDVGETWRTGLATSFAHYSINPYFKEINGNEHLAYVDNYKLFYFKSTDNGASWIKQQVITGHEGDIQTCALTVDTAGNVFIGITVHDLYNYANPTGITSGSHYFYYDAYCATNKSGSWVTELVYAHTSNYGPKVAGLFVDSNNNVHLVANYYGWYSYGGTAWEWVRNSGTDTWGARLNIVQFSDMMVDRLIYDTYAIVPDQMGNVTIVMSRNVSSTTTALPRLFYVRHNGTSWSAPVNISDSVAVAWNRFDAVVDPAGHTYIAYMQNDAQGLPALKVMKDFQAAETASINLPPGDTLYYFRLHCNSDGLFTIFLSIKNQNTHTAFSRDMLNWGEPIPAPDDIKNQMGGVIVRTDARQGYFTEYCEQVNAIAGPRSALPYGPDTLLTGSIKILGVPSTPDLVAPPDAGTIDTSTASFAWTNSIPEVTHYWIEIDTSSQFSYPYVDSTISGTDFVYDQLEAYRTYYWRVKGKNQRCWGEFSETFSFNVVYLGVGDDADLPKKFALAQNHPNPFNPTTTIKFDLPADSYVRLKVFNMLGEDVATLLDGVQRAGHRSVQFNAGGLTSGVYFYKLETNMFTETKKLILIR